MKLYFLGGLTTSIIIIIVANSFGMIGFQLNSLSDGINQFQSADSSLMMVFRLILITCLMALFPDIHTNALFQVWFFRFVFVTLLILLYFNEMDLFAFVIFIALVPFLQLNANWTHWLITPWILALSLGIGLEYLRVRNSLILSFSWDQIADQLKESWIYLVACVLGHYSHLSIDFLKKKKVPGFR